jgi:hypothetical protein
MKTRIWQTQVHFVGSNEVTRRFRADEVVVGADPHCDIRLPLPAPSKIFKIEFSVSDKDGAGYNVEVLNPEVEIQEKGEWKTAKSGFYTQIPFFRYQTTTFKVVEITSERRKLAFEPEKWAAQSQRHVPDSFALWHFKSGVLIDSVVISKQKSRVTMKAGFDAEWTPAQGEYLNLHEADGVVRRLEFEPGRGEGSYRAGYDDNIFVLTKVPESSLVSNLPKAELAPPEKDYFKKTILSLGATWILVMFGIQLMPETPALEEVPIEALSTDIAKIILEAPKPNSGGDGRSGGGGVETVSQSDKRGGSGFEQNKIAESAGPDEVVVKDKGALAALDKVEKVLGVGVLKALDAGGAISTALSALDEGVKSGKVKAAGIPGPSGSRANGKGAVGGVLGALNVAGGGGSAGGGVGIGGVGTKGYGGGGGGGTGKGFGTGIGDGLGKGDGARTLAFESENLSVRGGLERSEVEAVIQENLSQIRYCYNKALRTNPNLSGKVTSSFVIGGDGSVKVSRVPNSTLASPEVEDCIKSRVASWKFPQPRGGGDVAVNYPFLLRQ